MSKKEKTNPLINFRRQEIDLVKFNEQTDKEQKEQIQKLLEDAYGDSLKIDRKYNNHKKTSYSDKITSPSFKEWFNIILSVLYIPLIFRSVLSP